MTWLSESDTEIWEVVLDHDTWFKIVKYAKVLGVTKSWVVRLCLKDFLKSEKVEHNDSLFEAFEQVKGTSYRNGHRHLLCLYGEDELKLRLVAARLRMNVSNLIRTALKLNLNPSLLDTTRTNLVADGVKINKTVKCDTKGFSHGLTGTYDRFHFAEFPRKDYRDFRPIRKLGVSYGFP